MPTTLPPQADAPRTPKTVTFVVEMTASSDYGDSPSFAAIYMTDDFLTRASLLVNLCAEHDLAHVESDQTLPWETSDSDEFRLTGDTVVISRLGDFWFSAYPKHANYRVETCSKPLIDIAAKFHAAADGDVIYLVNDRDEETLRELYEEEFGAERQQFETDAG